MLVKETTYEWLYPGLRFTKLHQPQIHMIFVTIDLRILRILRLKVFSKQVSLNIDATYCENCKL
jgi:hypothetical protein